MKTPQKYVIGIDEAGRGPLAGPVAVGVACVPHDFDWELLPGVGDSKKVSPKNREAIFRRAQQLQKEGKLLYSVSMTSPKTIDRIGIVPSITKAMSKALQKNHKTLNNKPLPRQRLGIGIETDREYLSAGSEFIVKLDGGLKAPLEYIHQETIIKGDAKEKVIGLASIMAKVTRDHKMIALSTKLPYTMYGFDVHKGYGTKAHRERILKHGLSKEHRITFCKNLKK